MCTVLFNQYNLYDWLYLKYQVAEYNCKHRYFKDKSSTIRIPGGRYSKRVKIHLVRDMFLMESKKKALEF